MARRAASHDPDGIFRGTRRSSGPEGNLRNSGDSCRVPGLVFARPSGQQNSNRICSFRHAPTSLLPRRPQPADPGERRIRAAGAPQPVLRARWAEAPVLAPARPMPLHAPLRAWASASWAVGACPGRGLPAAPPGTRAGPGPRIRPLLCPLGVGLGRPRPEEPAATSPSPSLGLLRLHSRAAIYLARVVPVCFPRAASRSPGLNINQPEL